MIRAKHFSLLFISLLISLKILSQTDYVVHGSLISLGIKLVDGGEILNSSMCKIESGDTTYQYSPYEAEEYGFSDGRVYVSKEIILDDSISRKVFLLRILKGSTTLYYYNDSKSPKTFYIERDSSLLIDLPKSDENNKIVFRDILAAYTSDCQNISDAVKVAEYSRRSLSELIQRYNKCELKPLPFFKFGILAGSGITKIVPSSKNFNSYEYNFDFKSAPEILIGVFVDYPISSTDLSFHPELQYTGNGSSYTYSSQNRIFDLSIKKRSVNLPLIFRYTLPSVKIRPFIDFGPLISHYKRKDVKRYVAEIIKDIKVRISEESEISKSHLGFALGTGIQIRQNFKSSITVELRYQRLYGLSDAASLNERSIQLVSGYNF